MTDMQARAALQIQAAQRRKKARRLVGALRLARMLLRKARAKMPQRRAFIATPINASYELDHHDAPGRPADANCFERTRDKVLAFFIVHNTAFFGLALVFLAALVVFVFLIAFVMWGVLFGLDNGDEYTRATNPLCINQTAAFDDYLARHPGAVRAELTYTEPTVQMPPAVNGEYTAPHCTFNQWGFNACIKVFTLIFSYINFLPIPWRVSIFVQVCGHTEGSAR